MSARKCSSCKLPPCLPVHRLPNCLHNCLVIRFLSSWRLLDAYFHCTTFPHCQCLIAFTTCLSGLIIAPCNQGACRHCLGGWKRALSLHADLHCPVACPHHPIILSTSYLEHGCSAGRLTGYGINVVPFVSVAVPSRLSPGGGRLLPFS